MESSVVTQTVPLTRDENGVLRVGGTRVPIDAIVAGFHGGATAEEIVLQYPSLELADVYVILGYYLNHRSEVDDYLRQRSEHSAAVRRMNEERFPSSDIRARLLARRRVLDEQHD